MSVATSLLLGILADKKLWPVLREDWLVAIATDPALPPRAAQVAILLLAHLNREEENAWKGTAWPRVSTLAARVGGGVCERTVKAAIGALIQAGYVRQKRRRGSALYTLADQFVLAWWRRRNDGAAEPSETPASVDKSRPPARSRPKEVQVSAPLEVQESAPLEVQESAPLNPSKRTQKKEPFFGGAPSSPPLCDRAEAEAALLEASRQRAEAAAAVEADRQKRARDRRVAEVIRDRAKRERDRLRYQDKRATGAILEAFDGLTDGSRSWCHGIIIGHVRHAEATHGLTHDEIVAAAREEARRLRETGGQPLTSPRALDAVMAAFAEEKARSAAWAAE